MKNKKVTERNNEELVKKEKTMKALTLASIVVLIILFVALILLAIKKGFSAVLIVPFALLLNMSIIFLNNWNELKREIKSRDL